MFDPVPWVVEGGRVTDETARVFANIATQDTQGISLPGDFKVTALTVPGGAVTIASGGMVVRNRQAPGQSYIGRASSPTQVTIPSTAASPRSDLLIARVKDPQYSPWQPWPVGTPPETVLSGPYFEPFVVSGVSASTTLAEQVVGYSAVELARIDIPANTAAITQAMVKPMVQLHRPRTWRDLTSSLGTDLILSDATNWQLFPAFTPTFRVPPWATHVEMIVSISSFSQIMAAADGFLRTRLGGTLVSAINRLDLDTWTDGVRLSTEMVLSGAIPVAERGTLVQARLEGMRYIDPTHQGYFTTDRVTHISVDVQWSERVV